MRQAHDRVVLSLVVPMYNEAENIEAFYARAAAVLNAVGEPWEIVCVDDGSRDATLAMLAELHRRDERVKVVELSRNFGKELALTAGIDASTGAAVIPIDADLQDPPELIPQMVDRWREGYDVVYATRSERAGETLLKRSTARAFYSLMTRLSDVDLPPDTGDFRLMSRQAVEALKGMRERNRFMKGMFAWVGYRQIQLAYKRDPRAAGTTKWSWWRLVRLAMEGITSFSSAPLQLATWMGFAVAFAAIGYAIHRIYFTLRYGIDQPGYASLLVVMLFLGSVQLITLGIIGSYLGRIYQEIKQRPLYLVRATLGELADLGPREAPLLREISIATIDARPPVVDDQKEIETIAADRT